MPFSILVLDLHNTLYDEALEYGVAINEAILALLDLAKTYGYKLTRETICKELSLAHRRLGSDWDEEAWRLLPSFIEMGLEGKDYTKAVGLLVERRQKKSKELTISTAYEGARETISKLKMRGVHVYVITEAAADAATQSISWLKLAGKVDGIYCYPSRTSPPPPVGTFIKHFPPTAEGGHLKKPQPLLLAAVALDDAIRIGKIPSSVKTEDVFDIVHDKSFEIPELPASSSVQNDASSRLTLKKTPYAQILERSLQSILYVGDSKFRDGLLARNAGVAFGYAAYGKKEHDSKATLKSLALMYAVTGWDKEVLKLTQEASRSETVNRLKPDFMFEQSLSEAMNLFV